MTEDNAAASRFLYSFVVDGKSKLEDQAEVFIRTLIACGVRASRILSFFTPSVSDRTLATIRRYGVKTRPLDPILDCKFCNKIAQLALLNPEDADFFVLCDTDLAFLASLDALPASDRIRAKPVDRPNPPIDVLRHIAEIRGYRNHRDVDVTVGSGKTFSVNCNGGLYIIPSRILADLSRSWYAEAKFLFDRQELCGSWNGHIDQISFAMAMLALGEDVEELPQRYNFPLHLFSNFDGQDIEEPLVLHYHDMLKHGRLCTTGISFLDKAVTQVNAVLEKGRDCNNETK